MVKFFPRKKSADKAPEAAVSPLMADELTSSSSSRLKDKERASRRKDREEKRKKRDERIADSRVSKESSSKSKKKSKPKLSQEEQDEKDANLGGCYNFFSVPCEDNSSD
mmetsp:Transcript_14478/g.31404  ORF Transcript_14478/g.31404 Transcript_14478/m.31404 type:complete len:109 (-) Transcript_14478:686-1012(-)